MKCQEMTNHKEVKENRMARRQLMEPIASYALCVNMLLLDIHFRIVF